MWGHFHHNLHKSLGVDFIIFTYTWTNIRPSELYKNLKDDFGQDVLRRNIVTTSKNGVLLSLNLKCATLNNFLRMFHHEKIARNAEERIGSVNGKGIEKEMLSIKSLDNFFSTSCPEKITRNGAKRTGSANGKGAKKEMLSIKEMFICMNKSLEKLSSHVK